MSNPPCFIVWYQWEALALLLIGISVNQLRSIPEGANAFGLPVTTIAYAYTLIFVSLYRLVSFICLHISAQLVDAEPHGYTFL